MKKIIFVIALVLMASCAGAPVKDNVDSTEIDTVLVDSALVDSVSVDSICFE